MTNAEAPPGPPRHGGAAGDMPTLHGERVVLRPVTDDDAPALLAILAQPGVAAWWRRATWDQVDEEGAIVFAIVVDGEIAGSIQFNEETDPDYLRRGHRHLRRPTPGRAAAWAATPCAP